MKKNKEKQKAEKRIFLMKETVVSLNPLKLSKIIGGDSTQQGQNGDTTNGSIFGPPN